MWTTEGCQKLIFNYVISAQGGGSKNAKNLSTWFKDGTKDGKFLKIIPVKKMSGYFNVDLKRVTVGLIFSLNILEEDKVELDQFEMGIHWTGTSIKYDTNSRHLDRITDFIINKVKNCTLFDKSRCSLYSNRFKIIFFSWMLAISY